MMDITQRLELEEELRQAQKMEAVGRLAGGVAHDFNNLLTIITGRTHLVLGRLKADDPVRRSVEVIQKTADRAAALTRQLLAFSRKQVLQRKVLDLNAMVADVSTMLRRLIGEDVDLLLTPGPSAGRVNADPGPARAGADEPGRERARRDAAGRHARPRDRPRAARGGPARSAGRAPARAVRGAPRDGHRHGHGRGDPGPHLRTVLHDQGARQGHRPRALDGARDRAPARRRDPRPQRGGRRHDLRDLPAPGRDGGRHRRRRRDRGAPAGHRSGDHPAGGGRGRRARARPRGAGAAGLHGAGGERRRPGRRRSTRRKASGSTSSSPTW